MIAILALLQGCATGGDREAVAADLETCPSPRPQVCTLDYRPVCAVLGNGVRKQYSNGCSACGDIAVAGYIMGPCAPE